MKLFIDTTSREKIIIKLDAKKIESEARQDKSQKLLSLIVNGLEKSGKSFKDISEIEVNPGPGSYTGIRVGISVANALAWSLKIPVNGSEQVVVPVY